MMSASDYYNHIARPTVEEFEQDRTNYRRAMLACSAALHVVDHVFEERIANGMLTASAGRRRMEDWVVRQTEEVTGFAAVRAFSLASKHAVVNSTFKRGFTTTQHMVATPSLLGTMVLGRTFLGDTVGGITLKWSEHGWINLTTSLRATMALYEREFAEVALPVETAPPAGVMPPDDAALASGPDQAAEALTEPPTDTGPT